MHTRTHSHTHTLAMSRSVKDLREIICLSRQMQMPTFAPNGSICDEPDDESSRASSRLSTSTKGSFSPATSRSLQNGSCDDNSDDESTLPALQLPLSPPDSASRLHRLRYDNPQPLSDRCQPSVDPAATFFPRHKPLPAVGIKRNSGKLQSSVEQNICKNTSNDRLIHKTVNMRSGSVLTSHTAEVRTNCRFDEVFDMVDRGIILIWLEQVNRSVMDIVSWCQDSDNFIRFTHFWLSEFPENRQHEILKLEYGMLCERLQSAFGGKTLPSDKFESFMQAVLHEYPDGLLCGEHKGNVLFLQHLEVIAVSKHRKALLADVRYSALDRRHFELLLAVRSYAVVSVWSAILDQFRSGEDSKSNTVERTPRPGTASRSGRKSQAGNRPMSVRPHVRPMTARIRELTGDEVGGGDDDGTNWNLQKLFDAVRLGYIDVVQYLFDTHKIESDVCDDNRKSLIFIATASSQLSMLKFLLSLPGCDVNLSADSGNTPLHVAANRGDVAVTSALLEARNLRIDAPNAECDDATPLLLAALHGHTQVVKLLLEAGADTTKTMSGQTAMDIARDFDHPDIVALFEKLQSPEINRP